MKRQILVLACVLGIAGWLASIAAACHSEIAATMDCSGAISFTATAWTGSGADDRSRSNSDVRVYGSVDNGRSWQQVGTGQFAKSNGFTFSGSFKAGSATSAIVKVQEAGHWGNGDAPAAARTINVARPSNCSSNGGGSGGSGGSGGGGATCPSSSMVSSASAITLGGGKGSVTFTVAPGCNVKLSLVSYKAPSPVWDASKASQQQYYSSVTNTLGAGTYTWSVDVPSCYYQVDFVYGDAIKSGPPFYGNNLIRSLNGGTNACGASTGSGSGTAPGGGTVPSNGSAPSTGNAPSTGTGPAAVPAPSVSLVKLERLGATGTFVAGPVTGTLGQTVYYQMVVKNTGTTAVSINLKDDGCDAGTFAPTGPQALQPGASMTFSCSHRLAAADGSQYVNTALVTASNAGPVQATATAAVTAKVAAGGVAGVSKTITHKVKAKKVTKHAKPARAVIRAADFTG